MDLTNSHPQWGNVVTTLWAKYYPILTLLDESEVIKQYPCRIRKLFKRTHISLKDEYEIGQKRSNTFADVRC